jgi:hypothetical protein
MQTRSTTLPSVECGCARCGRSFGPFVLEPQSDRSIVPIDPAGRPGPRTPEIAMKRIPLWGEMPVPVLRQWRWEPMYGSSRRRKGPRTGTGPRPESFGERRYLRVVCKCGRNEKLGREKLDAALFDAGGRLQLRDGVLYL